MLVVGAPNDSTTRDGVDLPAPSPIATSGAIYVFRAGADNRFTQFTTYSVIVMVVLLIGMYIFIA